MTFRRPNDPAVSAISTGTVRLAALVIACLFVREANNFVSMFFVADWKNWLMPIVVFETILLTYYTALSSMIKGMEIVESVTGDSTYLMLLASVTSSTIFYWKAYWGLMYWGWYLVTGLVEFRNNPLPVVLFLTIFLIPSVSFIGWILNMVLTVFVVYAVGTLNLFSGRR